MRNFKNYKVWIKAVDMATNIYKTTGKFPQYELYGITSQIRRSVVSISSNITEGAGRKSDKEFNYFLNVSYGSTCELETQLLIAKNLKYLDEEAYQLNISELHEIQKMLFTLSKTLST